MRQTSSVPGSRYPLRRAAVWIGILSLLLSLLTPVIQPHEAAAQGDPPNCDPGYVVDEALNECVPDPNAQLQPDCLEGEVYSDDQGGCVPDPGQQPECDEGQVYDEAYGGCVPDPNLAPTEPAGQNPVGVRVEKYNCTGLDIAPSSASLDELLVNCDDNQTPVQLTVGSDAGEQSTSVTNFAEWTDLPAGSGYVSESIPEGYGEPVVWCGVYVPNQSQPSPSQYGVQNGNAIGWQLEPGEYLYCWWFNVFEDGGAGAGTSWIDFYKYECAWDTPTDEDADYYQQECQPRAGWDFDVQWDGGGSTQTTEGSGLASWSGVPTGSWTGSESVPEGYGQPIVYCRYVEWPDEAPYDDGWFPYDPSGGQITYQFEYDDVRIECWWFNFLPEDGGGNWVDLYKYECAFDTPTDQDKDYYDAECQPRSGWEFDLTWDGGGEAKSTGDDGLASWSGLPQGEWQASESLPEGYGEPLVWCRYVEWPDEASYDQDWESFPVQGGSFPHEFEYGSGVRIECHIYNFAPDGEGSWIEFYKYDCPEGTGYDTDASTLASECTLASDYDFTVESGDYSETQTTDDDGYAEWSGVPTGQYTVTESLPGGYGDPIVYCRYTEWSDEADLDDSTFLVEAPGGVWSGEFDWDGTRIVCGVFNIPGDGGPWIDFYKYECAFDEATDQDVDYYQQECDPVEGWEFDVQWDGGGSTQATDTSGLASWSGVSTAVSWVGAETVPEGYGQPLVWCRYVEWPDGTDYNSDWFSASPDDGVVTGALNDDGVRIECWWFNFAPGDTNWIDVTKWYCAETVTMPYEQSADNLAEECERYTEGVDLTLEYTGGSEAMTTDGEGNAEWADVPSGPWTLHEAIPEGYGDPVVWCRWVEWPEGEDLTNDPVEYGAPGGNMGGEFPGGGYRLHCDIFNIVAYDPGWITVYKWYCPVGIPTDSSAEYLRDECDLVTTGVDFSLSYGETSIPMTTDTEGKAEWNEVPQGEWSLEETSATSYGEPIVWCQWVDWPPEADTEYTHDLFQPEVAGAGIAGSHEYPGLRLVCYWFNFGYEGGDHEILIYKYWCAPGSAWGDSLDAWLEGCPETSDGVSFTLDNESGSYPQATSGGSVRWTDVQSGDFTVQEAVPAGYEEPRLWCYRYEYEEGIVPALATEDFDPVSVPEGLWQDSLDEGSWRIVCYWFNIAGDDNTVTVYKYNCEHVPAGFNTLDEWLEACPNPGNDAEFTLDHAEGGESLATAGGQAEWTDVPEGAFTLTESPYAGYGEPVIWCGWTAWNEGQPWDQPAENVPAPGGVYHGNITLPGTAWYCYWFNIPEDESHIVVYKYNCPEGVTETTLDGYQEACTEWGDGIEFTLANGAGSSTKAIAGGSATWHDVPQGEFTLTESVPDGYGEPVWWCGLTGYENGAIADGFPQLVEAPDGVHTASIDFDVTSYFCWVFNEPDYDREVTVYKWYCPHGLAPESEDWADTCTQPASGVEFNLTAGDQSTWKATNPSGKASWYGYPDGENTLREEVLPGYEPPVVYCSLEATYEDGAAYAENFQPYPVSDSTWSKDLDYGDYTWVCHVYNVPKGPGEITFYKWWCPPGYDASKWGANPKEECTQAQDDIPFVLDRPVGPNLTQDTGDEISGGVTFDDLDPGAYTVSEMVPAGTAYVFIWDCVGGDIPAVHPKPLTWGNVLHVDVAGGDSIVCNWYNVPEPEDGWLTVYKYQCSTKTYVSDVDCETYEFGAEFELFAVDGNASQGTGITSPGGTYTWNDLEEGSYTLDETDGEPCKVVPSKIDESGNPRVDAGQETVVKVYNCQSGSSTPTPGGKVPGKYPNTGVGPAPIAAIQDDDPDEGEGTGTAEPDGTPTDQEAAAEFYQIACLNTEGDGADGGQPDAAPATEEPQAGANAGTGNGGSDLPPFLQPTGDSAGGDDGPDADSTDAATEPAAEDDAVTQDEPAAGECERGAVPERMVIDAADVDHEVEILEIIDGVMQAPTGPNVVSWYKETARLGESNNIVIAAHVNWWNVPEGPFSHLADLIEGDRIEITGEDGQTYVYEVQWVRQESNLEAPDPEVVGPTGERSLTLITCGGEWDASISEYNERTVARAVQVEVIPAEDPETAQDGWLDPLAA